MTRVANRPELAESSLAKEFVIAAKSEKKILEKLEKYNVKFVIIRLNFFIFYYYYVIYVYIIYIYVIKFL